MLNKCIKIGTLNLALWMLLRFFHQQIIVMNDSQGELLTRITQILVRLVILAVKYVTTAGIATFGASATQSCNTGYDLIGTAAIPCGADGSWRSASPVTCTLKCMYIRIIPLLHSDHESHELSRINSFWIRSWNIISSCENLNWIVLSVVSSCNS